MKSTSLHQSDCYLATASQEQDFAGPVRFEALKATSLYLEACHVWSGDDYIGIIYPWTKFPLVTAKTADIAGDVNRSHTRFQAVTGI